MYAYVRHRTGAHCHRCRRDDTENFPGNYEEGKRTRSRRRRGKKVIVVVVVPIGAGKKRRRREEKKNFRTNIHLTARDTFAGGDRERFQNGDCGATPIFRVTVDVRGFYFRRSVGDYFYLDWL
jgi:hypothetical protein